MKTFISKTKETMELALVHCNKCGTQCDSLIGKDYLSVDTNWGYFSNKDCEKHCWDLCENCYDEFVKDFKIPLGRFEYSLGDDETLTPIK